MASSCSSSAYWSGYWTNISCLTPSLTSSTSLNNILDTYSLEEILEMNDLTVEDALEILVEEGYVELPEIKPLDLT